MSDVDKLHLHVRMIIIITFLSVLGEFADSWRKSCDVVVESCTINVLLLLSLIGSRNSSLFKLSVTNQLPYCFYMVLLSTLRRNEETNEREVERVQMSNKAGFFEKPLET